ncbi:putative epoxidase LasC [Calidithermus terrae]|uniref:Putative epoxidase LasC n=1 Tax=Calidithermus terrae TaxID=1408545 RepID=A0A399DUQ4_9DEIN|nr:monooxygenase [Calidithermus terrae]RIH75797.1 putative epoxidase LasC [Calidithermus terrae]
MHQGKRAVVIGGSMGGLLAARALAGRYEEVTVLERDHFPAAGEHRKGVPQGRHAHGLLAQGRAVLEEFFPGLTRDLVAQGAKEGDIVEGARWYHNGGFHAQFPSGLTGLLLSRPLLEGYVRGRVTGVRLDDEGLSDLRADLVVDASGRGSQAPKWLEALGYERPAEDLVRIDLAYATRVYRRRPQDLGGNDAFVIGSNAPEARGGVVLGMEGDRWVVTLAGFLGDHPPTDEAGFLEFARSLPVPDVYDLVKDAEPLSGIVPYKFPGSQRRRYERMARFPEGFLVMGDALCSFNPVFGQGMTVAAAEAKALARCLEAGTEDLARRFFREAAALVDSPWGIAVGADLRYPQVQGPRGPVVSFVNWYVARLHVAARRDRALVLAFQKVANLMAPPPSLLAPKLALRVLWGNLKPRGAAARPPGPRQAPTA